MTSEQDQRLKEIGDVVGILEDGVTIKHYEDMKFLFDLIQSILEENKALISDIYRTNLIKLELLAERDEARMIAQEARDIAWAYHKEYEPDENMDKIPYYWEKDAT